MTIKQKQHLLAYLGYYKGSVDGKWGDRSKSATRAFQDAYFQDKSKADGICGNETEKALKNAVANGMPAKAATNKSDFWDDIKYFKKDEFKCKCGKYCNGFPVEPNQTLIRVADRVRKHFGVPVTVSSGVRCEKHNANVGGVSGSRHKLGKAMDFCVKGKTANEVLAYVKQQKEIRYCYAIDKYYVHMDVQ